MTVDMSEIIILVVGSVVSVLAWFLKRDIHRFEAIMSEHNVELKRHSDGLATISAQMASVLEIQKWNPNLQRFFGEGGGHSRLWRNIDELGDFIEQLRERDHWIANKMSIIKGSLEIAKIKCGDAAEWHIPEWKVQKKKGD